MVCCAGQGKEDFCSIEDIEKHIFNRKVGIEKSKIPWLKTKVIKVEQY